MMILQIDGRSRWFQAWLRTGLADGRLFDRIEIKHNPWHDWITGRFTFAGQGRHVGSGSGGGWMGGGFTGGGSGGFGGGGASGIWETYEEERRRKAAERDRASAAAARSRQNKPVAASKPITPAAWARAGKQEAARLTVYRNGYEYQLDAHLRTRRVTGTITLNPTQNRSRRAQAAAGGKDRQPTDDGGHYVARRFNGPTEAFNHFAQDASFNRGAYRALEDLWASATRSGKKVFVTITPLFDGASQRPSEIQVIYTIDGTRDERNFTNNVGERRHDK